MSQTLRVDNLANKAYVGSVIVADGNGRFFEPALPRSVSVLFNGRREF
jgi:iron complex outermembrane receptor protein